MLLMVANTAYHYLGYALQTLQLTFPERTRNDTIKLQKGSLDCTICIHNQRFLWIFKVWYISISKVTILHVKSNNNSKGRGFLKWTDI